MTAASRVRVDRPPAPAESPPWEGVAAEALAVALARLRHLRPSALYPSRRIAAFRRGDGLRANELLRADGPIYEAAMELARRIRAGFRLRPGRDGGEHAGAGRLRASSRRVPGLRPYHDRRLARPWPARALCQRLHPNHSAARERSGSPAPTPRTPGCRCGAAPRSAGSDFDPTNAMSVHNDHIVIARGRDYSDASPIESMVLSSGSHDLEVRSTSSPCEVRRPSSLPTGKIAGNFPHFGRFGKNRPEKPNKSRRFQQNSLRGRTGR